MALQAITQKLSEAARTPGGKVATHGSQAVLWTLLAYKVNSKASDHWTVTAISLDQTARDHWTWVKDRLFASSAPDGEEVA